MLKKITSSFAIRILGVLLTFFAYSLMARAMSKDDYGIFMYFLTAIPIVAIVYRVGLASLSINAYNNPKDYNFNEYFNTSLFIISAIAIVFIIIASFININVFYYCLFAAPFALVYFLQAVMKASRNIFLSQFLEQVSLPACMLILVGATLFYGNTLGYKTSLLVYGGVFTAIFFALLYFCITKLNLKLSINDIKFDNAKKYLKLSYALAFTTLLVALTPRIQTLMLGNIADNAVIAEFAVIARLAALTTFLSAAISHVFDPVLTKLFYENRPACKSKLKKILLLGLACNIIGVIFFAIFGKYVLMIFGESYTHLTLELVLLAISYALSVNYLPNLFAFIADNKQMTYFKIQFLAMLILCITSVFAYKECGLLGLCYASIVTNILLSLVITFYTRKILRTGE